ncbi:MAG: class I SAM-dependent methyltransferase [Thermoplasmata archaeon]
MSPLLPVALARRRVLEFGCGLGGNLISMSRRFDVGLGVDINPGFVGIARRLARRENAQNVSFEVCGPYGPTDTARFNFIFSIGVFERLPTEVVRQCLSSLTRLMLPECAMATYFLTPSARGTAFTSLLGDGAYNYWSPEDVSSLAASCGLRIANAADWSSSFDDSPGQPGTSFARLYVLTKGCPGNEASSG